MISSLRPQTHVSEAPRANAPAEPSSDTPAGAELPQDSATLGASSDSRGYRVLRGLVGGVAGFSGAVLGASMGGVKGAFSDEMVMSPIAHRGIRGIGAVAGLLAGFQAGAAMGPLGIVVGVLAGPIVGAVAGSAAIGAIEAGGAAIAGAVKTGITGARRAHKAATEALDTLVHGKRPEPTPAPASEASAPSSEQPAATRAPWEGYPD